MSVERPFLPTATQRTVLPSASQRALERERAAEDLRVERAGEAAVARQRDDRDRLDALALLRAAAARAPTTRARPTPAISSLIVSAYGRIASIRACARRSFAAATSSIARVILRVLRTERIRRLRSWTAPCAQPDEALLLLDVEAARRTARAPRRASAAVSSDEVARSRGSPRRIVALGAQVLAQLVLEARHLRRPGSRRGSR